MLKIGQINTLTIQKQTPKGVYLVDDQENETLLPDKDASEDIIIGDTMEVFLYKDSENNIIATILKPKLILNGYASLKAVSVNRIGAFFDWGLEWRD